MDANLSVGRFITKQDTSVQIAMLKSIGNRALGRIINLAIRIAQANALKERNEDARDEGNDMEDGVDSPPPAGLEPRKTPTELLEAYAEQYACAHHQCEQLSDDDQYDRPQTVTRWTTWLISQLPQPQSDEEKAATRLTFAALTKAEKLAFLAEASEASADRMMWSQYRREIERIAQDAIDENYNEDSLDLLVGVEAHQNVIAAAIGLARTQVRLHKAAAKYKPREGRTPTPLYRRLVSEVGVIEASMDEVTELSEALEEAYLNEIVEAVKNGQTLKSMEDAESVVDLALEATLS